MWINLHFDLALLFDYPLGFTRQSMAMHGFKQSGSRYTWILLTLVIDD